MKQDKVKNKNMSDKDEKWNLITLRIPFYMLDSIGIIMVSRPGLSRNAWILEAIQEKLRS